MPAPAPATCTHTPCPHPHPHPHPAPTPRARTHARTHTPRPYPTPAPAPRARTHTCTCPGTASAHEHALHCPHHPRAAVRQTKLKTEQLVMQQHLSSTCDDGGTTWIFSSCSGILELRRVIQDASCVGPGKSNLPFELRRKAGDCSRVTAGPIDLI